VVAASSAPARPSTHRVVHRSSGSRAHEVAETTTTTVTTAPAQP